MVWRVAELCAGRQKPLVMPVTHESNVFTAVFSCDNAYIYSGGESELVDDIVLVTVRSTWDIQLDLL